MTTSLFATRRIVSHGCIAASVALALVACGSKSDVTKVGTSVLDWDQSQAGRIAYRRGKLGDRAAKDYTVTWTAGEAPLVLTVHVETAMIEYQEGGGFVRDVGAVAVKATIANNADWTVRGGLCESGPNYRLGDPSKHTEQPGLVLDCRFDYVRRTTFSSWQMIGNVQIDGAALKVFPPGDATVK